MADLLETDEAFDRAILRFLEERAADAIFADWHVEQDDGDSWVVRLWVEYEFKGRFRVSVDGSELLS